MRASSLVPGIVGSRQSILAAMPVAVNGQAASVHSSLFLSSHKRTGSHIPLANSEEIFLVTELRDLVRGSQQELEPLQREITEVLQV